MYTKFLGISVFAGLTLVGSIVSAQSAPPSVAIDSNGKLTVGLPTPPPTTGTAETDAAEVAGARAAVDKTRNEAAAAFAQLTRARVDLNQITSRLRRELETNNDLVEATKAVDTATAAYENLTAPILAELVKRADYRDATADLDRAQQISAEVSRAGTGTQERVEAAQAVLSAKTALAKFKQDALSASADVMNAKSRCMQARQHLSVLRSQLEQAMHQNADYLAAIQAVADAREHAVAADQQVTAANENLEEVEKQASDRALARERFNDFLFKHGVSATPPQ